MGSISPIRSADGDVGRGQLFGIAVIPADPFDAGVVAGFGNPAAAALADGIEGVAVNLAVGNPGDGFVQQVNQAADEARLGLPPLAQEDDVLPGKDGVFELRDDGVLEADDAGEGDFFGPNFRNQVVWRISSRTGVTR